MKKVDLSINDWCKSCGICAVYCPGNALNWERGAKPEFSAEKCIGCGLCVLRCPDFAIKIDIKEADHEA